MDKIIFRFGGQSEMARKLGHKFPSTVQAWKRNGKIPPWRFAELRKAQKKYKLEIPEIDELEKSMLEKM